jgi:hypothetical protein
LIFLLLLAAVGVVVVVALVVAQVVCDAPLVLPEEAVL